MVDSAVVVYGEASESDDDLMDEDKNKDKLCSSFAAHPEEVIEVGSEVTELPLANRGTNTSEQLLNRIKTVPTNDSTISSAHSSSIRKLSQRNKSFHENLTSFKTQLLNDANRELNLINQQLLKSQIELQESLICTKTSNTNLKYFHTKINDIITAHYIPRINIKVPPPII